MTMIEKIERFAAVVQRESIAAKVAKGIDCDANIDNCRTKIKAGRKYTKVDIGGSGRYMVNMDTGTIYGIKAYGQVHRGKVYGTVDTIGYWNWGEYYPSSNPSGSKCIPDNLPVPTAEVLKVEVEPVVGMGVTEVLYSDREPYEVIQICTPRKVTIREMTAKRDNWSPEIIAGGFAGHCVNQDEQKWVYKSNEAGRTLTIRKSMAKGGRWFEAGNKGSWFAMGYAKKFHDYNF